MRDTFFGVSIAFDLALGGANYYAAWWRDTAVSALGVALGLLAVFVTVRWAQIVLATSVAALVT